MKAQDKFSKSQLFHNETNVDRQYLQQIKASLINLKREHGLEYDVKQSDNQEQITVYADDAEKMPLIERLLREYHQMQARARSSSR